MDKPKQAGHKSTKLEISCAADNFDADTAFVRVVIKNAKYDFSTRRAIVIVLDASYSMVGPPFEQAKAAVLSFINDVRNLGHENISLVVFSEQARLASDIGGLPEADLRSLLNKIRCDGGTSFAAAMTTAAVSASALAANMHGSLTTSAVGRLLNSKKENNVRIKGTIGGKSLSMDDANYLCIDMEEAPDYPHWEWRSRLSCLGSDCDVVFFTDGQETCDHSLKFVRNATHTLQTVLGSRYIASAVHCIGFTDGHDAGLLAQLAACGSAQGSFQYVKTPAEIREAMDNVLAVCAAQAGLSASVIVKDARQNPIHIPIMLERQDDGSFTGILFVPRAQIVGSQLQVEALGQKTRTFNIRLAGGPASSSSSAAEAESVPLLFSSLESSETLDFVIRYIRQLVVNFTVRNAQQQQLQGQGRAGAALAAAALPPMEDITSLRRRIDHLDSLLDTHVAVLMMGKEKMPAAERALLIQHVQDSKQLVAEFHNTVASMMAESLPNEQLAALSACAYRGVIKRGLQKKLNKRAEENVDVFAEIDTRVREAMERIDFDALKLSPQVTECVPQLGPCLFSGMDWLEAMEAGDCFCVALDVYRPAAAIADPCQLVVRAVHPSVVTAHSFLDAAIYSISNDGHDGVTDGFARRPFSLAHPSKKSSPFDPRLFKGGAGESVTGAFPLYLSPEHWSIARHRMKPVLGFITTLDALGYSYAQVRAIPSLVLARSAADITLSERSRFLFTCILDTCMEVYRMSSTEGLEFRMSVQVVELWSKYATDATVRTIDGIPSNLVFASQLLCAAIAGDVRLSSTELRRSFALMCEEEARRKMAYNAKFEELSEHDKTLALLELMGIGRAKYKQVVNGYVDAFRSEQMAKAMEAASGQVGNYFTSLFESMLTGKELKPAASLPVAAAVAIAAAVEDAGVSSDVEDEEDEDYVLVDKDGQEEASASGSGARSRSRSPARSPLLSSAKGGAVTPPALDISEAEKEEDSIALDFEFDVTFGQINKPATRMIQVMESRLADAALPLLAVERLLSLVAAAQDANPSLSLQELKAHLVSKLAELRPLPPASAITYSRLGISTNAQKMALIIQNMMHFRNSARRLAISSGKYASPFDRTASRRFLLQTIRDLVTHERNVQKRAVLREITEMSAEAAARVFVLTDSLHEAAGCLIGLKQGGARFSTFYRALQNPTKFFEAEKKDDPIPLLEQKIRMLLDGEHKSVDLVSDKKKNPSSSSAAGAASSSSNAEQPATVVVRSPWHPSKNNAFKLWLRNRLHLPRDVWYRLFPDRIDKIRLWAKIFGD